jgi:hypothetical protein
MLNFKQYINEIRQKDLENIDLNRNLLFNNIFGDKLRVLIPLGEDLETREFMDELEDLGYIVNYSDLIHKKIIYKKIKTKEGTKERAEKVGKVLQNEIKKLSSQSQLDVVSRDNVPPESWQEYIKKYTKMLDWWQKNSENLKNSDSGSSVIISRSPIDLVRMSDHDNISSCHSPDGSYFKCAKQEAKTGGAVAYVVKNSDLKDVDIQKPELFEDEERKIEGIVPLERLRLRRFSKGEIDLLVPEIKTYGTSNIGFYGKVKQWAKDSQKDTLEKLDPEKDYENFDLKGGSYQDSPAEKIWSNFFDNSVKGHKTSLDDEDENEGENTADDIYNAAEAQIRQHQRVWKHFSVHHDIYDNENNVLDYTAYCSISIPRKLFTLEFSDEWNDKNYREIKNVIESNIDIYSISDISLNDEDDKNYHFNISVQNEDPYHQNNQLVRLEHFLDYIDDIDGNFDTHVSKVYRGLINKGYIKSVGGKLTFKNFTIEEDDYEGTTIKSVEEKIAYLKDFPVIENIGGNYRDKQMFTSKQKIYINDFRNKLINSAEFKSLKIFPFNLNQNEINFYLIEGITKIDRTKEPAFSGSYSDPDNFDPIAPKITKLTGWVYFELEKTIGFDITSNTKTIQFLKNIDNNWDFYIKKLNKFFESFLKMKYSPIDQWDNSMDKPRSPKPEDHINFNKKIFPQKPVVKKSEKQLTFKDFVNKKR